MMNFYIDLKSIEAYVMQSRSMSDPPLSDIDFKNKMAWVWTTLKTDFKKIWSLNQTYGDKILKEIFH